MSLAVTVTSVDWEMTAKVVGAAAPVAVAALGYLKGPGRLRSQIRYDAETLAKLPDNSTARALLDQHVLDGVARLRKVENDGRVDLPMLVVSLIATPSLAWFSIWLFGHSGWLWKLGSVVAGVVALVFLYGIFETSQRIPRDEKGKALPVANG